MLGLAARRDKKGMQDTDEYGEHKNYPNIMKPESVWWPEQHKQKG